jgi:hypothetical protein
MRRMFGARTAVATAVSILAVVAVGGAYAATRGGGTTTVCVHDRGGGLYLANKCARHDRRVQLSVTGPPSAPGATGPQGPAGPAGTAGAAGTPGPPATRYFAQITSDGTVNASGSPVSVDHLATGLYLVNFGIDVTHCTALANQGGVPEFWWPGANTGAANGYGAHVNISTAGGTPLAPGFPSADTVSVATFSGSTSSDTSFEIAVFC